MHLFSAIAQIACPRLFRNGTVELMKTADSDD